MNAIQLAYLKTFKGKGEIIFGAYFSDINQ